MTYDPRIFIAQDEAITIETSPVFTRFFGPEVVQDEYGAHEVPQSREGTEELNGIRMTITRGNERYRFEFPADTPSFRETQDADGTWKPDPGTVGPGEYIPAMTRLLLKARPL